MVDCKISSELKIGDVTVPGRVWIAPMTGVSDLPFRQISSGLGACYAATEMVACAQFAQTRPDVVRRAALGNSDGLMVIQLVGHDPQWIARGARLAKAAGAQIIDLNLGCPAKEVTGVKSGAALMRDVALAKTLISAAVDAVGIPVTVKMRLGWDEADRNAPDIATCAEAAGAAAVTVHGRTRQQFYTGNADWAAVGDVKRSVKIPVLVNGDIVDGVTAASALSESGADGVMIGRGAMGRPWIATTVQTYLTGGGWAEPTGEALVSIIDDHLTASTRFYGEALGVRMFRKHLARYIDYAASTCSAVDRASLRGRLCRMESPDAIRRAARGLWGDTANRLAA